MQDIILKYSEGSWTIMMLETNFLAWNVYFRRYGNACVCLETTNLTNLKMHIFPVGEMITHGEIIQLNPKQTLSREYHKDVGGSPGYRAQCNWPCLKYTMKMKIVLSLLRNLYIF